MNIIEATQEFHRKAWSSYNDFTDSLEKGVTICRSAYESGENSADAKTHN